MADIIDAFVVSLGIDPTNYNREIKNYRDDRKRLGEEEKRANQTTEDSQKRLTANFRTLRNEATGFLLVLAGANSVKQFVGNILTGDAAVGRLAKNLGVATESLSAWQGAVQRVGGSSGDIDSAFRSLSGAFQSLQLTGTTGNDADFQGLGVSAKDLRNPEDALLKISDASSRMGRSEFSARLGRLGFNESTITLLARGRGEVTRMLEEQRRLGVTTDKNADAAAKFDEQLSKLEGAIKGKLRPTIEGMVGGLVDWIEKGDNVNNILDISAGLLVGVGVAAAGALGPIGILAGAVAILTAKFVDLNKAGSAWQIVGLRADKLYAEAMAEANMKSNPQKAGEYLQRASDDADSILRLTESANAKPNYGAATQWSGGLGLTGSGTTGLTGGGSGGMSAGEAAFSRMNGGRDAMGNGGSGGQDIVRFFKARGYTDAQARGIAAGIMAESGGSHGARNGSSGAFGLGQWLGPRKKELMRRYGPNPTRQQQLEFLDWELRGGDHGGAAVLAQRSAGGTLNAYVKSFMRPAAGGETMGDLQRGNAWLNGGGTAMAGRGGGSPGASVSQTTTVGQVIVYSAATDAEGVARDMRGALAKRGLVAQANTGLTG